MDELKYPRAKTKPPCRRWPLAAETEADRCDGELGSYDHSGLKARSFPQVYPKADVTGRQPSAPATASGCAPQCAMGAVCLEASKAGQGGRVENTKHVLDSLTHPSA
eukprot:scaffold19238_cov121-Isochrysis_galbana.AAC.1